ncbi:sensor histidine kinase [Streptomyces sp. VRA16 Mangrove soil]|uniref:sensor histidine kinase n=1 Tax=Streptomyces sp. VRA16 Mangrove soil TaxID=2817434 RepID=UPI001A9CE246|nr:sensor histidine kinase [Streptomyces sp. VRA16 Mangrove soil]MBO1336547.1 sensor histidine kinase [Streptomyces sp. VRA16 Mangrove soil]
MTTTGEVHRAAAGGPWWWERRRSALFDVALGVASAAECAVEGIAFGHKAGLPVAMGVVFGVLAGATLVLRRRWPIAVVLVSVAIAPAQMGLLLTVVGLYSLAASEVPRRIIGALATMSFAGTLIVTVVRVQQDAARGVDTFQVANWFIPFIAVTAALGVTAPPLLLGLYVGARRRLMESLQERNESLERELLLLAERAEERAEWARGEERTRIAREMHDVVAHRVSLMVVHAAALQAVARKDPEKAVKNAALVGDMGRQALTELREMLGVLRSGEAVPARAKGARVPDVAEVPLAAVGVAAAAAASRAEAEAESGPCLAELEELVGQSRAAGMVVEMLVEGEVRLYAAVVEQTAYRVVQEALTNVHKHAAGAKTYVRLAHRGAEVAMQVENEPPPVLAAASAVGLPSGGNGLVGMKERVAGLGGVFVSGPTDAGGFRVSAVLPTA